MFFADRQTDGNPHYHNLLDFKGKKFEVRHHKVPLNNRNIISGVSLAVCGVIYSSITLIQNMLS